MNKTETIDDFEVKYRKNVLSKSIKITLRKENSILVTLPYYCPYKKARDFLLSNIENIKTFEFPNKIYNKNFKTKFDTLKIVESDKTEIKTKNNIVIFYYSGDFEDKNNQKLLKEAHTKALRIEASNYLPQRLHFLAYKYGFSYKKVFLKNQKTRFGSCSFQNNINLNISLMKYDYDVIDYVIIHELVHTKIKNHSLSFWKEVEKYCPNYKNLRKKLKSL